MQDQVPEEITEGVKIVAKMALWHSREKTPRKSFKKPCKDGKHTIGSKIGKKGEKMLQRERCLVARFMPIWVA